MARAFIGLGSNLAQPAAQIQAALHAMTQLADTQLIAQSSLYGSKPMGPQDQPDYVNAVVALQTSLTPHQLLDALQRIELEHGRVRKAERWGPRTLDLDILLFDDLQFSDERLTIPHYGMRQREFVIYPLLEIAPLLVLPDGTPLRDLQHTCDVNGLIRLSAQ